MSRLFDSTGDGTLSPYDFNFDSVSMRSSTIVDSEYAAEQVRRHELSHQFHVPVDQRSPTNAINVQIQVLNNGTFAASEVNSVDNNTPRRNLIEKISFASSRRRRKLLCLFVIPLVIFVIGITSVWAFLEKMNDNNKSALGQETRSPESTYATTIFSEPTSTLLTTSTTSTTKYPFVFMSRSEWGANQYMKGNKRLRATIECLIIMDTQSKPCYNISDCASFLKQRQKSAIDEFFRDTLIKDIRENFLIAPDGTVFEGRGFFYEGQHTYDRQQTDYNSNAVGISFIGNYANANLTLRQETAIHAFIQNSIDLRHISENYNLYHQGQLALNLNLSENILYKTIQTWDHWKASPAIISKKQWGGLEKKGNSGYFSSIIENSAAVGHSNGSSCNDLSSCSEIVRDLQLKDRDKYGEIRYNFIFGGEDLIFQGRSFDLRGAAASFSLDVLFIGDYNRCEPPQSLLKAFEAFLKFAVDIGKLSEDYKLYGQRQLIEHTESPGDKLFEVLQNPPFDVHFDFNVTAPSLCLIGCNIRI